MTHGECLSERQGSLRGKHAGEIVNNQITYSDAGIEVEEASYPSARGIVRNDVAKPTADNKKITHLEGSKLYQ